ncbi:ABC-type antimicrobial peptide transport system, ATPase component [Ignavibacterium album JCM 16511]|uniref:ABC-type antimicrobial peptide transport system, ATPase component n=1 Tax=Ignavibacterium album (strain DSM 19864 / JCM 16511 / NBRC 101810 / Mat9-16) TaxID=945713 RepID=I0APC9_IGNAJ|nr:ABC transporter ATP-binding protein [Ignavibacterium album]AFH50836.1 ABC-type antimicrobial peptide transport system, ATPase component [Ignavibacterium album JCM 16511]
MKLIELTDVSQIYDETIVPVKAVDNVSLQIDKGEFTAIVGPSGSGKTTLLNLIGGLDQPTSGKIFVDGTDISTYKEDELINFRLHHIGFVFQAYNLIPVFTAKENVEFIMLLQNISKEVREKKAIDFIDAVGLKEKMNNFPTELSGGQQQRVAVARALASTPSFVLADEPTANLDSVSAESLLDLIEELNVKHNMTFIFSTHDEKVIKRAHRIIQHRDGRIEKDIVN